MWLRENYTLKRLYRWELTTDNKFVKELRNKREEKGIWLVEAVSKLSKHPKKEIAAMASIITAAISYLALLEENCPVYNGTQDSARKRLGGIGRRHQSISRPLVTKQL